jgi:hypothetical protein
LTNLLMRGVNAGMSTPDRTGLDVEAILNALYASEINASISWQWDGGIDVKLGNPLSGYKAERKVSTFAEVAACLRDQACTHYPDSEFARKYGGFADPRTPVEISSPLEGAALSSLSRSMATIAIWRLDRP